MAKKKSESPTQRARKDLKAMGAVSQIVEHWNPHAFKKQDLFGFIDIIALIGPNTIGIQVTTGDHHAERREKILAIPEARAWLVAGNMIEVWSYSKRGAKGKIKKWECRKEEITLEDFVDPIGLPESFT